MVFFLLAVVPSLASGELTRKITQQYERGTTKELTYYDDDREVAKESFNETGRLIEKTGTIPDGVVREYFSNNSPKSEYTFKDNKRNGPMKWYYEVSGKLWYTGNYVNNLREGEFREWAEDGTLKRTIWFRNDKPTMNPKARDTMIYLMAVILILLNGFIIWRRFFAKKKFKPSPVHTSEVEKYLTSTADTNKLPVVSTTLALEPGEEAYLEEKSALLAVREKIDVQNTGKKEMETYTKDEGTLTLTNKRINFRGAFDKYNFALDKVKVLSGQDFLDIREESAPSGLHFKVANPLLWNAVAGLARQPVKFSFAKNISFTIKFK